MKIDHIRKLILPPEPILSLLLIGLLLLSAVLYYRAVNIQRFLEPALAISQPRNQFAQNINRLLLREFGTERVRGIRFVMGSIIVEWSLFFDRDNNMRESAHIILRQLSNVFMSAMNDGNIRSQIELIIVSVRFPLNPNTELNNKMRLRMQHISEQILDSMYKAEPRLAENYGTYFAATSMPMRASENEVYVVEFLIVPSELVHIELLQRLQRYAL